jgi:hypothetical protein
VPTIIFVGSLDALERGVAALGAVATARTCVVATAAAFRGVDDAIAEIRGRMGPNGAAVRAVGAGDRASASDPDVVAQVATADVVILSDGAPLHARLVWRHSALGDVLANSTLVCVGSVGSVVGATMIDPRGGAPTTGLGLFDGVVVAVRSSADQSRRTRGLLVHQPQTLVELGPRSVVAFDGRWRVVVSDDLEVTRAGVATVLGLGDGE